ncbi:MAG: 4-demethylwyosine synthase TYW1 [Candidatus ainarchaeum sp.]|nr:4-demethylwyosine synthase TYW1 [Candidatus ainarchaeum sp.]
MMSETARAALKRQGYKLFGANSSAKLCHWTRKSIYGEGACYKEKFYGIRCHRCIQMTPATDACTHNCVFCWRAGDFSKIEVGDPDEPAEIVKGAISAQREIVSGFKGEAKTDQKKWQEAREPRHAAISLSGEPFSYPLAGELVSAFHGAGLTTFVVTNGTFPGRVAELKPLPTQLYVSLVAPDAETYSKVCAPLISGGWEKIGETLRATKGLGCRRVIRMTAVKGFNMHGEKGYAERILLAEPEFVEVKSYMHRGSSIHRLAPESMPSHEETRAFAEAVAMETGYSLVAEAPESRVVLLARDEKASSRRVMRFD